MTRYYSKSWWGLIAYLVSLIGTFLLANERIRSWAIFLLVGASGLALIAWRRQEWRAAFSRDPTAGIITASRYRLFYPAGAIMAVLIVLAADLRYLTAGNTPFGVAGALWLGRLGC